MIVKIVRCDVCNAVKCEGNKWLRALIYRNNENNVSSISIFGPYGYEDTKTIEDICSDTCLQKRLGQVLAELRK